jgi:riboflavin kinase/FMN adenylyltransferase
LGRPYSLIGEVVKGDGRGRQLGFPTANIDTRNQICPPNGVYAIRAKLEGRWLDGVLNIGTRPTFNELDFQVESYFFDFNETIYGKSVEIFFVEKIRSERKFPNLQSLIQQIQRDVMVAAEILAESAHP